MTVLNNFHYYHHPSIHPSFHLSGVESWGSYCSRETQTSLSAATMSSPSWGIPRPSQVRPRTMSLQHVLGHAGASSHWDVPGTHHHGVIQTKCPRSLIWLFSIGKSSSSTPWTTTPSVTETTLMFMHLGFHLRLLLGSTGASHALAHMCLCGFFTGFKMGNFMSETSLLHVYLLVCRPVFTNPGGLQSRPELTKNIN